MEWQSSYRKDRRKEVVLSRLRNQSCFFMVQHYFTGQPPQNRCDRCQITNTLKHIFIHCPLFNNHRYKLTNHCTNKNIDFKIENLLNDDFEHDLIFDFLKSVNFYSKI